MSTIRRPEGVLARHPEEEVLRLRIRHRQRARLHLHVGFSLARSHATSSIPTRLVNVNIIARL
jgi:hypothetical protein